MKRKKLVYTWEVLDKLLKLDGAQVYNTSICDRGLVLDVYGREMEHVEGSQNCSEEINTYSFKEDEE